MKNWTCLAVLVLVALVLGADEIKKPKGVFSSLKVGQHVSLKDEGSGFTLSFFDEELPLAHKVIEIGDDFVLVRDVVGVKESVIPVYSIKAIEKVRTKGLQK